MRFDKFKSSLGLPFRMCFIILLMLVSQGIIVELFLFSIINHLMSRVPVRILPKVSGILLQFNHYYLPIFLLTSFIFSMGIFVFVKKLTAPFERIRVLSREIASGEYSRRINLRQGDNLFEIGENINKLALKLEESQKNIRRIADSLDKYTEIGYHLCNIIDELKVVSKEHERSLREDRRRITELCEEIEGKTKILKELFKEEKGVSS